jgi:hypothetical protein
MGKRRVRGPPDRASNGRIVLDNETLKGVAIPGNGPPNPFAPVLFIHTGIVSTAVTTLGDVGSRVHQKKFGT